MDTYPRAKKDELARDLAAFQERAQPADSGAFAAAMDRFIGWVVDYGVVPLPADEDARAQKLGDMVAAYRRDLKSLPADLLHQAIEHVIATHRFRNWPLPADLLASVRPDLLRRTVLRNSARAALRFGRWEHEPVPSDQRVAPEKVRALARELAERASMAEAETPEDGEAPHRGPRIWNDSKENQG